MERKFRILKWLVSITDIFTVQSISWYPYFTLVLAEIVFLWGIFQAIAIPFTCLFVVSMLNIIVCSLGKDLSDSPKLKKVWSIAYIVIGLAIFTGGFFFGILPNLVLFAIPLGLAAVYTSFEHVIWKLSTISKFFRTLEESELVIVLVRIVGFLLPISAFVCSVCLLPVDTFVKVIIWLVYFFGVTQVIDIEANCVLDDIFSMVYDISGTKECKEKVKDFFDEIAEQHKNTRDR